MQVRLGNVAPVEVLRDTDTGEVTTRNGLDLLHGDHTVTEIGWPDDQPGGFGQLLNAVTSPSGMWYRDHSDAAPAWVSSDDPDLARAICRHFTDLGEDCEVRKHEKVASVYLDPKLATPKAMRDAAAGMAERLGGTVSDTTTPEG